MAKLLKVRPNVGEERIDALATRQWYECGCRCCGNQDVDAVRNLREALISLGWEVGPMSAAPSGFFYIRIHCTAA